ncbi:MAG TPA: hypothetical protein VFT99_13295 [Roseiflexaceae bacterium]|nr:hypothetical protein [Roseiflexaceae bacterium]
MFDHAVSAQLDSIVFLLDHNPPWLVRVVLRAYKRALERTIVV